MRGRESVYDQFVSMPRNYDPTAAATSGLTPDLLRDSPLRLEQREHGQDAPVVVRRLSEAELAEDRVHVRLDGLRAEEKLAADARVRAALGHQLEHAALALGQGRERVVGAR